MSILYIVRHGQASFFSDNYDQLSEKGFGQARLLGNFWRESGIEIDEVYTGSLERQIQTAEGCGETYASNDRHWPEIEIKEGLNEYHSDMVMDNLKPELTHKYVQVRRLYNDYSAATDDRQRYSAFHRLLEVVMQYYIAGNYESTGFETWQEFHDRVTNAFTAIRNQGGSGRCVAIFTSGGPIGVSVQSCLKAPEQQAAELNWRVYNASVTQFTFRADRISLDQFNTIPHLPNDMRTYR